VRNVGRRMTTGMAAGVICLAASWAPLLAAMRSINLSDGSELKVWEQPDSAAGTESRAIYYALTNASGTRTGVVPPTMDVASDSAPFLALDSTGTPVMVWSRSDGWYRKIAYARFSGVAWANYHFLTFGPGDEEDPRIGIGSIGSYLFYFARPDRYLYVPLDLVAGRLFAVPRVLDLGSARRDVIALRPPGSISVLGGVDAPVTGVIAKGGKRTAGVPAAGPLDPGKMVLQGGTDVPVVSGQNKAMAWGVGSSGDCVPIVLVIPARDLKSVFVFRFYNGILNLLERVSLPTPITERFGEETALSFLPTVCD